MHLCFSACRLLVQSFSGVYGEVAVSLTPYAASAASDDGDRGGKKSHKQNSRGCCRIAAQRTHHKGLKTRPGFAFPFQVSRAVAAMPSLSFTSNSGYKI